MSADLDLDECHWTLFPAPDGSPSVYEVGDPVFVWLRSNRETGHAHVLEPEGADGRVLVQFDCDASMRHRVRKGRLVPIFRRPSPAGSKRGDCTAVVCGSTDSYRRLARSQVTKADSVLEVGCSTGACTALLAQHAGSVVGIDISQQLIREARSHCPGIRFEQMDALQSPEELAKLGEGCSAVFVDIGGNRQLSSLVTLLPWVQRRLAPQLLVVKSEALAEAAGSWLAEERRQAAAAAAAGAAEKARPGEQQEKAAESAAKPPAEQRPGRERSELHWSKVKDLDLPAQSKAMDSCGAGAGSSSATCGNSCGAGGSGISSGLVLNGARPPSFGDAGAGLFESGTPSPLSPLSASGATPRDACSADAAVRGRFVFTLSLARVFLGLSCLLAASLVIEVLLVRIHQPSSSANTNMAGGGAGFAPVVVTAWSPRIAALLPPALRPLSIGAAHAVPLAALTALSVAGMLAAIVVAAAAELVDACSADVGEEEEQEQEQEQQQEQQQQRRQRQRQRQEHEEGPGLEREQPVPRSVPSSKQQRPGTATAAAATAAAAGRVHDPSAWWEKLRGSCGEAEVVSNPLFYKAKLKGFHRVHPMKFPERRAPGGARICRPFNYATCKEGDRCPFDHAHCHHCLAPGHKAQECGA